MKYKKIILGIILFSVLTSCKKSFEGLLNDPSYPDPSAADVDLYLNEVQLSFKDLWNTASDFGAALTRQQVWGGPFYRNAYQPASFDAEWTTAYTGVVKNADALIPLAHEQKKYIQAGIARILKAYTVVTLVDDFGDVPFGEADLGNANSNPSVDPGAAVYAGAIELLDSAITDLQNTDADAGPAIDLFYKGNVANWVTLAKTLKLKFYMQQRLIDNTVTSKIQALLTEDDLINDPSQDFVFQYGTNVTSPDSRHPHYAIDYTDNGVGEWIGNYFIWMIAAEKNGGLVASTDPRRRYYFYRPSTNYAWATQTSCPCFARSIYGNLNPPAWYPSVPDETPFCVVGSGYLGRDHGDNSGAPPDDPYRTAWGVYPAGGEFDASTGGEVYMGMGAKGAGISPIWLSSFTSFLKAEAVLTLGVDGDAKDLLLNGVDASINKVINFPSAIGYILTDAQAALVPTSDEIAAYEDIVSSRYDDAESNDDKLNVLMTEYYLALWGNGVEPYNNYRRTGKPGNTQIAVAVPDPGLFMRSFFYPSVFVNRNSNAPAQKNPGDAADKVFWDNNPDNFIK